MPCPTVLTVEVLMVKQLHNKIHSHTLIDIVFSVCTSQGPNIEAKYHIHLFDSVDTVNIHLPETTIVSTF